MIPSDPPEIRNEPEPGLVFRRYRLADGRTFETYEVPATAVRALGMRRIHDALDIWCRGEVKRAQSAKLLAAITERLADGVKPLAIADELGCSEAYVRQVRKRYSDMVVQCGDGNNLAR